MASNHFDRGRMEFYRLDSQNAQGGRLEMKPACFFVCCLIVALARSQPEPAQAKAFKLYLSPARGTAIDKETATVFAVGFVNRIPHGALMLVLDVPMVPEGIKTAQSDETVKPSDVHPHRDVGADAVSEPIQCGESVKHVRF